ncbi:MarR family winged helix-turn-helix transcriptional regulator [Pseudomonas sp. N3-W]|uniref:MarR family winged helix-turn-helix transcriptional regulator n=1 Tax=Pseudomonas sp. N3-W TaxID=2975049 RepID=UPI00217F06F1|nr:MarR family winged helix-turn-helix transcriptional regulator [Pseudomonas sp. N3-W]UWF46857.1 MarR family winged helix-turn-helix transcriptional regulator [Pseudomonas sp. N3-W]
MKNFTPPIVSSLDAHMGFWLRYVSNQVSARFQKLLEDQGTSVTEWVALRVLFDEPEASHAELIQSLGMTKGAASKVVSRLEEKGLATRRLAEGSSKEQVLALTTKGRALVPKLAALADQNDDHFFGHLSHDERGVLMKTFKNLVAHHNIKEVPVA